MKNRMTDASQQFIEFCSHVTCWLWETLEKLLDIFLDFLARTIELILAVMNLIFQVICFLRDLYIESMQTFANIFRGIVNIVRNISCDEIEEFASACIVFLLWLAAFQIAKNLFQNSRVAEFLYGRNVNSDVNNNNKTARFAQRTGPQSRTRKRTNRRNGKRAQIQLKQEYDD